MTAKSSDGGPEQITGATWRCTIPPNGSFDGPGPTLELTFVKSLPRTHPPEHGHNKNVDKLATHVQVASDHTDLSAPGNKGLM